MSQRTQERRRQRQRWRELRKGDKRTVSKKATDRYKEMNKKIERQTQGCK